MACTSGAAPASARFPVSAATLESSATPTQMDKT